MSLPHRNYLLAILLTILAFNYVDRWALGLVLQDIKTDLSLSDTQLGVLSGIAFAVFYSVMGIPIARWADRGNRVAIIALTTLLWSVAVALSGSAGTFLHLLLIRVGVAVGEAGCIPPAHSLIADYFTRAERARAMARYMLGAPLSLVIGYFLAGWLNESYGWRVTFALLGLPGIALAALAWLTLREPRRGKSVTTVATPPARWPRTAEDLEPTSAQPGFKEICATLWSNATFRQLLLCFAVASFFSSGMMQWKPAFFIRSYGLQTAELGMWFAVIYGFGGLFGTYLGGELASRYAVRNEHLQLRVLALVYLATAFISAGLYLSSNPYQALGLMGLTAIGSAAVNGPLFAIIQTLIPPHMRALSVAVLYLFANLIGMGLGPLMAGVLSDVFRTWAGEQSLRYALLALCPGYLWVAWHLRRASGTVTHDLAAVANG